MASVYVSSTTDDLRQERLAVMDWLAAARLRPVQGYQPNSDTLRHDFLDILDTCDLYVLILGHRYGLQLPPPNHEHLSITHQEFRRAGQAGIPRIALLRASVPDVSRSDVADPVEARLLERFREEVAHEVRAAEFHDLDGLIQGLSAGVQAGLDELDKRVRAETEKRLATAQRAGLTAGIFLNYRRDDSAAYALLLESRLKERFPDAKVFMDLDSIRAGRDFIEAIRDALDSCAVLVALIGRQWVTIADEEGRRRLDNPDDWVRSEIRTALESEVLVIPVLVDRAKPLRQQELPGELHKLARLNAFELSYDRFQYDAGRLLDLIQPELARIGEQAQVDRQAREEVGRKAREEG
jgi:hypothetical protein